MQGPWEVRLVAHLCRSKAAFYPFEGAWYLAIREHPPRSRTELAIVDDVKRYCDEAWHGRRPKLAMFRLSLVDTLDLSEPAARLGLAA